MWTELALYAAIALAGFAPLLVPARRSTAVSRAVGGVLLGAAGVGALLWSPAPVDPPPGNRPVQIRDGTAEPSRGFVSSDACRACHPDQYRSWHESYHRTMTQVVTPETVIADFEDPPLMHPDPGHPGPRRYRAQRRGDAFWVEVPDPLAAEPGAAEPVWRRVVMSTGLHHYQLYWYSLGEGRELRMFPFVYLREEERWVPRGSVFLKPPEMPDPPTAWNFDCLPCHSTDGQPRFVQRDGEWVYDTRAAEMGISCEACHGPGRDHVRVNTNPARRYGQYFEAESDATIVQPEDLPGPAASDVCGQCHSVNFPPSREGAVEWLRAGSSYRAGERLADSRYVMRRHTSSDDTMPPFLVERLQENPTALDQWFWPDGEVRVTGRELNGLIESPCYEGGDFSCLSCHSLHDSDPDDQLAEGMRTDRACLQCHDAFGAALEAHTHHPAQSDGSRCYNCHMPHTTYGLLKASRSHTVRSPSAAVALASGRPTGCNICHLDRSLEWTAGYLSEWYGHRPVKPPGQERRLSAAALALLEGDAGQRALAAWAMGWDSAQRASGREWLAPLLARGLDDPYDVVRYIAGRSLRGLPGFESFEYDFVAAPEARRESVGRALDLWAGRGASGAVPSGVLLDADGRPDEELVQLLVAQRNDRPMVLAE